MGRELSDDIADDIGEIFTDPADFGVLAIHRTRQDDLYEFYGTFNQTGVQTGLTDNRQGRHNESTAFLLIGTKDRNGAVVPLDDQGRFEINGQAWPIWNVTGTPGGYLVTLKSVERKTMRHLPGNS